MSPKTPGVLIASGRESDVFDIGNGRVLRRSRLGRPAATEALTMTHVARHGFPAPHVFDADGPDLILERINGRTMVQAFQTTPWKLGRWAVVLAALVEQVAAIPLPDHQLLPWRDSGDVLTHMDLHPNNVMLTESGPVVLDWGHATAAGHGLDAAMTWLTLASGQIPGRASVRYLGNQLRNTLVKAYGQAIDQNLARPYLEAAYNYRRTGPHVQPIEVERMSAFLKTFT